MADRDLRQREYEAREVEARLVREHDAALAAGL
jgi:hypothetical protein